MHNLKLKNLLKYKKKGDGRNNYGRTTVFHRGGGNKHLYRQIDYKRSIWNTQGIIIKFYKDYTKSADIALVCYKNGILSYISKINNLKLGDFIITGNNVPIKLGNALPLKNIPIGTMVCNIEVYLNFGAQLARAAGSSVRLIKKNLQTNKATIILSNNKRFQINLNCLATIGTIGNINHKFKKFKNAGEKRKLGYRPIVRGVAMNPVDHPMGGGEGKTSGGRCSVSPWGKFAKSGKTRFKKKINRFNLENASKMET